MIRVENLRVAFGRTEVVHGVSFDVEPGQVLALVGESGSGKSVTARAILGLSGGRVGGTITLDGAPVTRLGRDIGFVSQAALVALDPLRTIGREVGDAVRLHGGDPARVLDVLEEVGIPDPITRVGQRSGELSGGLRQRAVIASAIAMKPRYLIADEPTTALDSTVALGVLGLLGRLRDNGMGMLLISHDLATVAHIASHVAVMQGGVIVETGTVGDVLGRPRHPYTRQLIAAVPTSVPRHARLHSGNSGVTGTPVAPEPPVRSITPEFPKVLVARGLHRSFGERHAVDDVSLELRRGETLGIVGESGSGKTTVARLLLGLDRPDSGSVERHASVGAIYQDALSSFDPRWTVRQILSDAATAGRSRRADVTALLASVGLAADVAGRSPRHLSGGQQQRVSIARAIASRPQVLVCDEPVSNLDVIAQAQVLDLLDDLQQQLGLSLVFISHDLGVVRHMSDRVLVMKDGSVVESGTAEAVFGDPQHDYTRALIAAAPTLA